MFIRVERNIFFNFKIPVKSIDEIYYVVLDVYMRNINYLIR